MNLRVTWWNTSCDPYCRERKYSVCDIGDDLERVIEASDVVTLGEFDQYQALRNWVNAHYDTRACQLKVVDSRVKMGNTRLKTCALIDSSKVEIASLKVKSFTKAGGPDKFGYRVGQRLRMKLTGVESYLDLYVVHWRPSHDSNKFERGEAAITLRDVIFGQSRNNYVICLGDFNVEPYEAPMSQLKASRDKSYARRHSVLFNPSWQFLGEAGGTLSIGSEREYLSSYLTVDQILVNGKLLDAFEIETRIMKDVDNGEPGHHHPVVIEIRRDKNG